HQKLALDGSHGLFRYVSILRGQLGSMFGDETQDRPQILHVQQQQSLLMRDGNSGPISETVARTGWPCSPNTSQNTVENWSGWNVRPISLARLSRKSFATPT